MNTPLIQLYRQAEDYFFKGIALKYRDLGDGAKAYMTGVPIGDLNPVHITKNINCFDKVISLGEQFYEQKAMPFTLVMPQDFCGPTTENSLSRMSYVQTDQSICMVINLNEILQNTAFNTEKFIKPNNYCLDDWIEPLIQAFEITPEIASIYMSCHKNALKKNVNLQHFSLYVQEKPVTSLTLSMYNNIARLDDIGTLSAFQGKGYASALITYALLNAKKVGTHHCFLESSDSGLKVYEKLGFKPLFKNSIYSKKI